MAQNIKVEIIGDSSSYERALRRSAAGTETFGSRVGRGLATVGRAATLAGVAVAGTAIVIGKKSVEAAIAAQEANDKLTQAFKNQGIQMDALSPAVVKLENASRDLGFANADTRESLTKLINSGKSYKQSVAEITVAQNLARVSGKTLGDTTTDLIRLQAGATRAAKQYGVILAPVTTAQDKLKASKVDLTTAAGKEALAHAKVQDKLATGQAYYDALSGKVKGQAQVFSDSAAGGIAQFHAALSNIEETLGAKLLPAFSQAIQGVDQFLQFLTGAGSATDKFKSALETMGLSTEQADATFKKLGETFRTISDTISAVVSESESLWATWGSTITAIVKTALDYIVSTIQNVFQVIKGIFQVFHGLLTGDWSELWTGLKNIFGGFAAQIMTTIRAWASSVEIVFSVLWHAIASATASIWNGIVASIKGALDAAKNLAVAGGHAVMDGFLNGLRVGWNTITGWLTEIPGFMRSFFGGAIGWLVAAGRAVLQGFLNGLLEIWGKIQDFIGSIGGWISSHKGPLSYDIRLLEPAGHAIMTGLHRGMASGMQDVMALTRTIAPTISPQIGITGATAGASTGGTTIQVHVAGSVVTENELADSIYQALLRKQGRNGTLGFA